MLKHREDLLLAAAYKTHQIGYRALSVYEQENHALAAIQGQLVHLLGDRRADGHGIEPFWLRAP
jgi:hypothetical protein